MTVHRALTTLLAACALIMACEASATRFAGFQGLGELEGGLTMSKAFDINDAGQVTGFSFSAEGVQAFLWSPAKGMLGLGGLLAPGQGSYAYGINGAGHVTGWSYSSDGPQAFLCDAGGAMEGLGHPNDGGAESYAQAINDAGEVVGWARFGAGAAPFLWRRGTGDGAGRMTRLGGGELDGGLANDINNAGQVVGQSGWNGAAQAFLWEDDALTWLTSPAEAASSEAHSINEAGQIVGKSGGKAVLWTNPAEALLLGSPSGAYSESIARDINNAGWVVGDGKAGARREAFLWDSDSGMQRLHRLAETSGIDLGAWTLSHAYAINDYGDVAGWGTNPKGNVEAWVLWAPRGGATAPELATMTLFGLGLAALATRRLRKRAS